MDENNKETTQEEPSVPVESDDVGNKPSTTSLISRADLAAERLEKALRMERDNLKMREALMVRDALGGRSEAGQYPAKPAEISAKDYAKEILSGKHNVKE